MLIAIAFLAGVLFLAPLICGAHLPFHSQMGRSHGLCIFVTTLVVAITLTIPLLSGLTTAPVWALALAVSPLFDPIIKPPH